jgi:hypothetical protein
VCVPVVAGGNAPPVLEPGEQVLDLVSLAMEGRVVDLWDFAATSGRDARLDASCFEFGAEPCSSDRG